MKILLRQANEGDLSFIYSSWLKSYRGIQKHVDSDVYFKGQHKLIETILSISNVIVVCPEDDTETIIGYVVYRGDKLHWIYVKSVYRNLGMARTMLTCFEDGKPQSYSHYSPAVHFLFNDSVYNPYSYLEDL